MAQETVRLAEYAAALRYQDLPAPIVQQAKGVHHRHDRGGHLRQRPAVEPYRHRLCRAHRPRRQMSYPRPRRAGGSGAGCSPRQRGARPRLRARQPDATRRRSASRRHGAAPALAIAQEKGADGRGLIAAFVAGNEVMIRIGRATGHTNEARGFSCAGHHRPVRRGGSPPAICCGSMRRR